MCPPTGVCDLGQPLHRLRRSPVSLRLGHLAVLTVPRTVIHYRSHLTQGRHAGNARPYGAESGFVGGGVPKGISSACQITDLEPHATFDAPRVSYNSLERDVVAPSPTVWV